MPKKLLDGAPMTANFAATQREFVAHIREPQRHPAPADVPPPRLALYRELLTNNIDNFLSSNFPVLRQLMDDGQWAALVQDFFARHASSTPYFAEIPEEFLAYLQTERDSGLDFPFLLELAHYEWVEMAVAIAKEASPERQEPPLDWMGQTLSVSPVAWVLAYQYPVHKIAPSFLPTEPPAQPTFLVVHRDHQDDVHFQEITPITYRLLELLQDNGSAHACLAQIAAETQHPQPDALLDAGLRILAELVRKGIVVMGP